MNDWRVRTAYEAARVTVLVIESSALQPSSSPNACHLVARLEPEAIVVAHDNAMLLLDRDGAEIAIESLEGRLQGVGEAIAAALA